MFPVVVTRSYSQCTLPQKVFGEIEHMAVLLQNFQEMPQALKKAETRASVAENEMWRIKEDLAARSQRASALLMQRDAERNALGKLVAKLREENEKLTENASVRTIA